VYTYLHFHWQLGRPRGIHSSQRPCVPIARALVPSRALSVSGRRALASTLLFVRLLLLLSGSNNLRHQTALLPPRLSFTAPHSRPTINIVAPRLLSLSADLPCFASCALCIALILLGSLGNSTAVNYSSARSLSVNFSAVDAPDCVRFSCRSPLCTARKNPFDERCIHGVNVVLYLAGFARGSLIHVTPAFLIGKRHRYAYARCARSVACFALV
jgi:hypothetical protein